jgi:hypothetical protein
MKSGDVKVGEVYAYQRGEYGPDTAVRVVEVKRVWRGLLTNSRAVVWRSPTEVDEQIARCANLTHYMSWGVVVEDPADPTGRAIVEARWLTRTWAEQEELVLQRKESRRRAEEARAASRAKAKELGARLAILPEELQVVDVWPDGSFGLNLGNLDELEQFITTLETLAPALAPAAE